MNPAATRSRLPFPASAWRWLLPVLLLVASGGWVCAAQSSLSVSITCNINLAPRNTTLPAITGIATQGFQLGCDPGTWNDPEHDPLTFTYQWRRARDGMGGGMVDIAGATGASHLLSPTEVDWFVSCRVTARDFAGNRVVADTPWSGPVAGDQAVTRRLWIISDPPVVAQMGDVLTWGVRVDTTALSVAPDLHYALEDAPADMTLTVDAGSNGATITWPSVAGPPGYRLFRLVVWDANGGGSHIQEVTLLVLPSVGGVAALAPDRWRTTVGVLVVVGLVAVGDMLGVVLRHPGGSGMRPVPVPLRAAILRRRRQRDDGDPLWTEDP